MNVLVSRRSAAFMFFAICLSACGTYESPQSPQEPTTIGEATMREDGTIVLKLRAEIEDATIGDALLTYPTDHADYSYIRAHLPDLRPGQSVPVPPFPLLEH